MRKGNTGKRFLTAVAIVSLSLTLAACAGRESDRPSLESSAAAAEAEERRMKDEAAAEGDNQQEQAGNPVTIYRGIFRWRGIVSGESALRKLQRQFGREADRSRVC